MTDYQQLITYGQEYLDDAITVAEKQIAKMYREAYKKALAEMESLYARLGDKLDLAEAQKYKRLENTIAAIAQDFRKVTGKAIELTGDTSAMSMTGAYQINWFGMEKATGTALQFGILPVDAIRDSVYSAVSGAPFTKRYGKLYTSTIDKVAEVITRGLATGQGYAKTAQELKDIFNGSAYQAIRVVRTESQRNLNNGSNAAYARAEALGIEGVKVWTATRDGRTRPDHARMNGKESGNDGLFNTPWGKSTGPGDGPADQVINCFLPETEVSGTFTAGSKSFYSGDAIELQTASGKSLTVTINHPIATDHGWVKAGELTEGMNAISYCPDINFDIFSVNFNNKNMIPKIIDVFDSMCANGGITFSKIVKSLDFHGDGEFMDSEINIVDMNGELGINLDSIASHKNACNFNLIISDSMNGLVPSYSSLDFLRNTLVSPLGSGPSTRALSFNKLSGLFKLGPFKLFCFGPASNMNTGLGKHSIESGSAYSAFIRKLFKTYAGNIVFDKIVKIVNRKFSGHVYDLQSIDNYVLSNGIVSSNCRCSTWYKLDGVEYEEDWTFRQWKAEYNDWKKQSPRQNESNRGR